ncbi:MAG: hypothetical protein MN733_27815, partial [Nitrososphaera sp.]|nr:hypothetical protein [Nitrososphaera sp.]
QQVHNKRVVVFCNDGAHGASRLFVVEDQRNPNWLSAVLPEGLPPGDSYIVADIDLDIASVEVATARPGHALRLIELGCLVAEKTPAGAVATALKDIAALESSAARAQELKSLLSCADLMPLQRVRINHLYEQERRGAPTSDWWPVVDRIVS